MKAINYIILLTLLHFFGLTANCKSNALPNLIIILTEDQGFHDVGFNGSQDISTPNLDSIASNGVRFTSGYVASPLSSPSRAGLLTGRYPARFGFEHDTPWQPNNPLSGLPLTESTLADTLGKVGYASGMIGKWHLGASPVMHPLQRGFSEFFGFLGAGHPYFPEEVTIDETRKVKTEYDSWLLEIMRNYDLVKTTNYLTDALSDAAVDFVVRHKKQPFFLLLAYNAPHAPLEATEKYSSRFPKILGHNRRAYAAMMSAVDDGVGNLLAELGKDGLVEQTLLVYLSASGGSLDANSSDNYPLRGSKNYPWEGGWRVPFAMQWPGHLPKGIAYEQPVLSLDIFATITAVANAPVTPGVLLDGVNLVPYLTGQKTGVPHDTIYLRMPDQTALAVQSGGYKLVVSTTGQTTELYDLNHDIAELKNLADAKPEVMQELETKGAIWSQQMMSSNFHGIIERNDPQPIDTDSGRLKTGR